MPNGIWTKETFLMDIPKEDRKMMSMTHDLLKDLKESLRSIDDKVDKIRIEQPTICQGVMDDKIAINNKLRRKINLGQGGGAGAIILMIGEGIRSFWPK